jgi:spermidine synthase
MKTAQLRVPAPGRTVLAGDPSAHAASLAAPFLFFLSGCTGLVYEIVWFKRFTQAWGSSSVAMTLVVATFLGGLGLGALCLGPRADRASRPLLVYGWMEIAIGAIALVIPLAIARLRLVAAWAPDAVSEHPAALAAVRFALTFVVIGPACVLMGATLPFVVKHLTVRLGGGLATAWLYALNTLGAATGCFLAGFFLLPSLGLGATNALAVAVNVLLGGAAVSIGRRAPIATERTGEPRTALREGEPTQRRASLLLASAAASGFAALALQIVWTRQLALILGGSTYAFTSVLFVVLVGIAVGSLIFRLWLGRLEDQGRVLGGTLLTLVGGAVLGKLLAPEVTSAVAVLKPLRESEVWNSVVCVGASCALQLVPAVAMGVLFPWFVHAARFSRSSIGAGVGRVYAFNTLGTITGAVAATFVLMPRLGTSGSIVACLVLYFGVWIVLFPSENLRRSFVSGLTAVLMLLLTKLAATPDDPRITSTGQFMYGYQSAEDAARNNKVLLHSEGSSCTVLVRELPSGFRALSVNGKTDASDGVDDMPMQLGLAYLPAFLHPSLRDVLVIGFGSGCTPGATLEIPGTRVTCCEIEPAVFAAAELFSHVNHRPHESPDLEMVFEDGRNHLQRTGERYDVILSEPSNPWLAGVSNLFTLEFYREAKERLAPGGLLAQWIQTYSISTEHYADIAGTVMAVFPECALLRVSRGDTILIASERALTPDSATLDRAQSIVSARSEIAADLAKHFGSDDVRSALLRTLLLDTAGVRRLVAAHGSGVTITDVNLRLEFEAPLALFGSSPTPPAIGRAIFGAVAPGWFEKRLREWGCTSQHIVSLMELERVALELGAHDFVRRMAADALASELGDDHFFVSSLIAGEGPADVVEAALPRIAAAPALEGSRLGVALCTAGRYDDAIAVFRALSQRHPASATTLANLSINLKASGKAAEAREVLERAMQLDPFNDHAREVDSKEREVRP